MKLSIKVSCYKRCFQSTGKFLYLQVSSCLLATLVWGQSSIAQDLGQFVELQREPQGEQHLLETFRQNMLFDLGDVRPWVGDTEGRTRYRGLSYFGWGIQRLGPCTEYCHALGGGYIG